MSLVVQTRVDMQRAREQTKLDVGLVRDFAHGEFKCSTQNCLANLVSYKGNRKEWEDHDRIVRIMSKEPVFDKSQKSVFLLLIP